MWKAIDRLMIATDDLERAQRQCVTLLGRSPSWSGEYAGLAIQHVLFRLANTQIELLAPLGATEGNAALRAHLDERGPGLFGMALETGDLSQALGRMGEGDWAPSAPTPVLVHDAPSGAYRRLLQSDLSPVGTRGVRLVLTEPTTDPALVPVALPLNEEMASVDRVDHVVISTRDADHAIALYRDGLGIRLALDRTFEDRGIRLLFFRVGGSTIEMGVPIQTGSETEAAGATTDRLWGIAYQVPDADRAHARLLEAGFELNSVRAGHKEGTRVFTVKAEPLGVPTLIIEPAKHGP